jgi:hypothetical protein
MAVTAETIYKRFLTSICVDRELQKWENLELTVMVFFHVSINYTWSVMDDGSVRVSPVGCSC